MIRLTPIACRALDADFDGDQAAVLLPVTEAGQREAGELLSIEGHLRRDPALLSLFAPRHEAMWGLARLSLNRTGHEEIERLAGVAIEASEGYVTRATLSEALQAVMVQNGAGAALLAMETLTARGFEEARRIGPSMGIFFEGETVQAPTSDAPSAWTAYGQQLGERLLAGTDFQTQLGGYTLAVRSGAFGSIETLVRLLGPYGVAIDADGQPAVIRYGYRDGLSADELFAAAAGMRRRIFQVWQEWDRMNSNLPADAAAERFNVLARARRTPQPGIVFANAAAMGETDRLADEESRNFVGL